MGLDKGLALGYLEDLLKLNHDFIDYVKIGWGTAVIHPDLEAKLELYQDFGVPVCIGGTLFELAHVQGKVDQLARWASALGIAMVEVSDGTIVLETDAKLDYIVRLCEDFRVVSEYGSKDSGVVRAPRLWAEGMAVELEAGAWKVIAEGREGGTSGLYRESSELRTGLVDEIALSVAPEAVIWEAPKKSHQAWLIERFGPNTNLGNIAFDDLLPLETLRLGLRSDTLNHMHVESP